ncbi:beta-ketoacyl synthase N-terminal-like domain-containing protein [Kibdelosporangium persicum]|uniref:Beta-ketoacyl synthase n=1 Tax=Kibdelosporangium persicum TaxID=2698649 RepID=A0ABX2FI57_9PSEU|nr:beta-ketoacyl synthase N-terminal-like domain-containing protein [Kibdelosporangium persicum]NRN70957.1 Beta-ketoacyl synthase [Kibdelosporangium persicum]
MTRASAQVVVTGAGIAVRGRATPADLLDRGPVDTAAPDPADTLTGRGLRYKDRATRLGMVAARAALADAGVLDVVTPSTPDDSFGVVTSSNYGNLDTVCQTVRTIDEETYLGTSPMMLPATSSNVIASWLAITHGLRGANVTVCNGRTSGLDAVRRACLLIAAGRVSRVLVVGVEPDLPEVRHVVGDDGSVALFDGAAAILLAGARSAAASGTRIHAGIGRYAKRADAADAIAEACAGTGRIGLRLSSQETTVDSEVHDLPAVLGDAAGALGVLQVAAATAWLGGGRRAGDALAVCGDDGATAAMVVTAPASFPAGPRSRELT